MAFEEVKFEKTGPGPKLAANEVSFKFGAKKWYLRFSQDLTKELTDGGYKYCTLEYDKETNEIRVKFRKYEDGIKLIDSGHNLAICHKGFCAFLKEHLNIKEETAKLEISDNRSNVLSVQLRYLYNNGKSNIG